MTEFRQHLLFVDDEERVLRGLERALWAHREQWAMTFVASGVQALEHLAVSRCDAIISDVRMPGMDGAQLLNTVMERHPGVIRIALSGYADNELVMRCSRVVHQYLAKPCDGQQLELVLTRLTKEVSSGKGDAARRLLARCPSLPSVPVVYSELVECINNPDASLETLAEVLAKDAGLSTQVLRLVNSAFFGLKRRVAEPREAVLYLGVDAVKSLVLSTHLMHPSRNQLPNEISLTALWGHCNECAEAARFVARELGASAEQANDAFLGGLLHDVGKLLLSANLREEYEAVLRRSEDSREALFEVEREVFGADHADLGGHFLGLLGLPPQVVEAVRLHHRPMESLTPDDPVLVAVHVGNVLAGERLGGGLDPVGSQFDPAFIAKQNLQTRISFWRSQWRLGDQTTGKVV